MPVGGSLVYHGWGVLQLADVRTRRGEGGQRGTSARHVLRDHGRNPEQLGEFGSQPGRVSFLEGDLARAQPRQGQVRQQMLRLVDKGDGDRVAPRHAGVAVGRGQGR